MATLLYSLRQNIEKQTLEIPIISDRIDQCSYFVYAFLGKMAKSRIRLAALSYALKMDTLLNSKKKLAILSSGGVFKNKKLQKGSTLPLFNANINSREPIDSQDIHIFQAFADHSKAEGNVFTRFKSNRKSPFIECEERPAKGTKPPLLKLSLKPFEEIKY